MFHHGLARKLLISAALLGTTSVANVSIAAPPTLESIAVIPAVRALSVGEHQRYTAMGTFSDGSTQALEAAISNLALGLPHTCVLLNGGGVDCWGDNDFGELGDGSTNDSRIARPVKGITTATAVAARANYACALLTSGEVKCWGDNGSGQLGSGDVPIGFSSAWPVRVTGIDSAVIVAPGDVHNCALLASGAVQCWGWNAQGELGNGTSVDWSTVPVQVHGIASATALASGDGHSCALLVSGEVQCWGYNLNGQLGNGFTSNSNVPVQVKGISNAQAVATGSISTCAILAGGAVQCWGYGGLGQLGNGSYADSTVPVPVAGVTTAVAITAGGFHACALLSSGYVQCWGDNRYGQLGNGSTTAPKSNTPVRVSGIRAPVRLVAGKWHTCALLSDGTVRCWGRNAESQLGDQRKTLKPTRWPVNVIGTPGVVWQSSDPTKATITMRGLAKARATGNTTITATTTGFINDNALLTVK